MKVSILNSVIILTAGLIILSSCQREHSNIFDPKNRIDSLDLDLKITQSDSVVRLQWRAPSSVEYRGFNIFRKSINENAFSQADSVAVDSFSWTDTSIQNGNTYLYYLTIQGENIQSPSTPVIKTTPGPDTFWILDRWNFYIRHFTFDLQHTITRHYAIDQPQNMCFNTSGNTAIITYTRQHYVEVFNPHNGEHIKDFYRLERPYDCVFDEQKDRFIVSDSSGAVYALDTESWELEVLTESLPQPSQMHLDSEGRIYVLDAHIRQILRLESDGFVTDTLKNLGSRITYFDLDDKNNILYAVSEDDSLKYLHRYSITDFSATALFSDHHLRQVRHSPLDESIWITLNNDNSAEILQLSAEGTRLIGLNGFHYISDMNISPRTGNIIVGTLDLETLKGKMYHLKPDGSIIGSSTKMYYPYRIYIK